VSAEPIQLEGLPSAEVPAALRWESYFDFVAHPFAHQALLENSNSVCGAVYGIRGYAEQWLLARAEIQRHDARVLTDSTPSDAHVHGHFEVILGEGAVFEPSVVVGVEKGAKRFAVVLGPGARVLGGYIYLDSGSIALGCGTLVEPGVGLRGPTIVGRHTELRQGAYLRGSCVVGDVCTLRGEYKNAVLMDKASFPHPCYVGDSLCGYMTHFGNQVTAANFGIFEGMRGGSERRPLLVRCGGACYEVDGPKMGVCMGDFCQVGCNSVADPGTFLKPYTIVYALTRISKGFYGPHEVLKNKPMERGVIERVPLRGARPVTGVEQ